MKPWFDSWLSHLFIYGPFMNIFVPFYHYLKCAIHWKIFLVGTLGISRGAHLALGCFLLVAVGMLTGSARCATKFHASRRTNREALLQETNTGDSSVGRASDCRIVQTSESLVRFRVAGFCVFDLSGLLRASVLWRQLAARAPRHPAASEPALPQHAHTRSKMRGFHKGRAIKEDMLWSETRQIFARFSLFLNKCCDPLWYPPDFGTLRFAFRLFSVFHFAVHCFDSFLAMHLATRRFDKSFLVFNVLLCFEGLAEFGAWLSKGNNICSPLRKHNKQATQQLKQLNNIHHNNI